MWDGGRRSSAKTLEGSNHKMYSKLVRTGMNGLAPDKGPWDTWVPPAITQDTCGMRLAPL